MSPASVAQADGCQLHPGSSFSKETARASLEAYPHFEGGGLPSVELHELSLPFVPCSMWRKSRRSLLHVYLASVLRHAQDQW